MVTDLMGCDPSQSDACLGEGIAEDVGKALCPVGPVVVGQAQEAERRTHGLVGGVEREHPLHIVAACIGQVLTPMLVEVAEELGEHMPVGLPAPRPGGHLVPQCQRLSCLVRHGIEDCHLGLPVEVRRQLLQ